MKIKTIIPPLALCALALGAAHAARADQVLYDGTGFLQGQQSFQQSFQISAPGTLTVSLTNVAWPVQLSSLSMLLSSTSGVLGPQMGDGTATFQVNGGDLFAQWFGTAQGPLNVGVYSLKISFSATPVTTVPLPAAGLLLLSGLGLLGKRRRQREMLIPQAV